MTAVPDVGPELEHNLEQEWKFDVDPDFDPPDLRPLVGRTERLAEQSLRTTYFDTADHRLWAQGITLRHRSESLPPADAAAPAALLDGSAAAGKWTLKLPDGDRVGPDESGRASRSEFSWKGSPGEVPAEARAVIAGLVRRAPLQPVTTLATTRRRLLLHGPEWPWAELDDDLAEVVEGTETGLRFRQIEVELMPDAEPPDGGLESVLAELRRAGAGRSGRSKFALAAGLPEDGALVGRVAAGRPSDVAGMVARQLAAGLDRLLRSDYRLRRPGGPDAEDVHQARVATRRLRSDLLTFAAALDPVWVGHVRRDLKWMGRLLGRVRDADVLIERLQAHDDPADADEVAELVRLVAADRHLDATELAEALAAPRYLDLLDRLHAASLTPPVSEPGDDTAPAKVAPRLVRPRLHAFEHELAGLGRHPSDRDLHQVRIRAKRLRYASETVEPYVGRKARRTASAAKSLQDVLGDLNDAINAARELRELACHPSTTSAVAFVAGRIAGRADAEEIAIRARWRKKAARLADRKRRSWLT